MLDEPSIQLSGHLVAYLDGTHLQNFSGVLEPGKSRTKHRADFARSRLATEMDRFAACSDRSVHDVLSPAVPKTNRRRTDHAFSSKSRNKNDQRRSCCGNYTLARSSDWKSVSLADIRCSRS